MLCLPLLWLEIEILEPELGKYASSNSFVLEIYDFVASSRTILYLENCYA